MDSFTTLAGVAAPLIRANIDTDTIIRIERLTNTKQEDTGAWLFESLRSDDAGRQDPAFVLNQPQFRNAPILLAGENFGCGSSREGAVWALKYAGIRCVDAAPVRPQGQWRRHAACLSQDLSGPGPVCLGLWRLARRH